MVKKNLLFLDFFFPPDECPGKYFAMVEKTGGREGREKEREREKYLKVSLGSHPLCGKDCSFA